MAKDRRILALDLGTTFGFYDGVEQPQAHTLNKDCRAVELFTWLYEKVRVGGGARRRYDTIVIENAITQMAFANEVFHELKAIVKLVCQQHGLHFAELAPTRIKKIFAGSGKAEKEDIIGRVLEMGLTLPYRVPSRGKNKGTRVYDTNAADAVAVFHTYLAEQEHATAD